MKKTNTITMKKYFFAAVAAGTMLFGFNSCAKKVASPGKTETTENTGMTIEPEKTGRVQILRDINSNYVIKINLKDLEELSSIKPDTKNTYIVWMDADNQTTKSLGEISSNTGWLADKSKASFEATSVFKPTKIFITEETIATVKKPSVKVLWSTRKF